MPAGKFTPGLSGVARADEWFAGWQERTLGRPMDTGDAALLRELAKTFEGERLPGVPASVPLPQQIDVDFRGIDKNIDLDPMMAIKHGFEGSPLGAIQRWASMDAPHFTQDPKYDHWSDPAIKESPFKDRPELFMTSQSAEESAWIMRYLRRHEKEASRLEAMTGNAGIFTTAGAIFGDPLTYTPGALGSTAYRLAAKATHLTSPGTVALGFKPVVWGAIQDGLRAASLQSAVALVDAGLHRSLDTTAEQGSIADIVALPSAFAGAIGFMTSAYTRYGIGMHALQRAHGDEAFLAGTRIKAARSAGMGPAAPGVLSEAEEAYWAAAAAKNPNGRFHVDGMVLGYDGNSVLFRTSEGLDVEIPALKVDAVSAGKGSRGIVVSSDMLATNKALQASAMNLDGPFVGGNYTASLVNQLDATLRPGALATDYPAMRVTEAIDSGLDVLKPRHTADFDQFAAGNKLFEAKGEPFMVYHGSGYTFDEFSNKELGKTTGAASAREGHFFAGGPATSEHYAQQRFENVRSFFGLGPVVGRREVGAPNIRPSYIRMANPKIISDSEYVKMTPEKYEALGRSKHDGLPEPEDKNGVRWRYDAETKEFVRQEAYISEVGKRDVGKYKVGDILPDRPPNPQAKSPGPMMFEVGELSRVEHRDTAIRVTAIEMQSSKARNVDFAAEIRLAREAGHDGVVIHNTPDGGIGKDLRDSIYIVFDPKTQIRGFDQRYEAVDLAAAKSGNLDDVNISKGSLSAGAPGMTGIHSRKDMLAGNKLVASGIGIEKLPFDVVNRAAMLPFTTWQTTVQDMLALGGRLHVRNTKAGGYQANAIPVETLIKTEWAHPTYEVIRAIKDEWRLAREGHGPVEPTDLQRIGYEAKTMVSDWRGKTRGISAEEFRRRVGDATFNGDKDLLTDQYTPQVNAAVAKVRPLWERIKNEATDVGLFKEAHQEQVAKAEARLAMAKKANVSGDSLLAAEKHLEHVKELLHDVVTGGPKVRTAKSYRPRIWLQDALRDRADEFKGIVDNWLRQSNPNLSPADRKSAADNIHETLTKDRPVWTKEEVAKNFNDLADPSSAKARTLMIPDMLVRDFLENDIEALVRHHSRVMGTGIEMHRRFGSTGMEDDIKQIWDEAQLLVAAAPDNAAKKKIMKQYDLAKADLEASRDRLYGHYGAPEDPHRWQSRTIRMAKQFTNLTVLGMSGITAMGDLVRPLMTEGLQAVNDYGFRSLAAESRGLILKMSRKELELAGDAMELIANTRALSMSDTGDMFRSRSTFERGLAKTNSWFFVANGLNAVNQLDKEWAGLIIQGNMNRALKNMTGANPERVPEWMKVRLAANGIDEPMALRIADQMRKGGQNNFGKLLLADTLKWTDDEAVKVYRTALHQMVNRTVPTPTLADTPNWMSSELGGLMMQYKAFSFGALNRTLLSGLQEESRQFWYGATAMVGFGLILNEMRSRLFYDRSTFDKPMTATLMDAVDRSSILGWFSDANRATEILTGHRAGIRPLIGAEKPRNDPTDRVIGTALGPAAGQGVNALSVLGDFLALNPTVKTMADARKMVPGQNIPYLDPVFDRLISDGSWYPKKPTKEEKEAAKVNRRARAQAENAQP